jgi:plastocyanin
MRKAALIAFAFAAAAVGAAPAPAEEIPVYVLFQEFSPSQIDALPGDSITWSNISERTHTVTAEDGSFDAGDLPGGSVFSTVAGAPGTYAYHCMIHVGMNGEIDVRRVTLGLLPPVAVPAGERVAIKGRTADPQAPVTIERDIGAGFHPVGTAEPAADGSWSTEIAAQTTGDYRAVVGLDASQTRRLLVTDRHVDVTATKHGIHVTVTPALPYGHLLLERNTRERFGWFPVARKRLDYVSRADFRVARPATIRVSIVDRDGWTPLATSAPLHLRSGRR